MQSTSSVRTFRPSVPDEPKKPKKTKEPKPPKDRKPIALPRVTARAPWIIIAVLIALSGFMFVQYRHATKKLEAKTPAAQARQTKDVVGRVAKLIVLPTNETPTIITIKDATKLVDEQFYAGAKNGDITLVYTKHKKAILYRPSANIIINVANVTVNSST